MRKPQRIAALCLTVGTLLPAATLAQEGDSPIAVLRESEAALTGLIERVEPSIVAIGHAPAGGARNARNPPAVLRLNADPFGGLREVGNAAAPVPSGAGVVVDAEGLILTQYLAIKPGDKHYATTIDGKTLEARIKAADPRSGLAVLEVVEKGDPLRPLEVGRAERLKKGNFVLAMGNPFAIVADGQPTASVGTVTNLGRKAPAGANLNNTLYDGSYRTTLHHFGTLIQTDARLGWNGAGGALVNLDGELIGVVTTTSTIAGHEQPAGYAIPLNETFRRVVEALKEGREVEYGMLGIRFTPAALSSDGGGVQVNTAFAGGPAAQAGLRPGDVITAINNQPVTGGDALQLIVGSLPPAVQAPVEYLRGGKPGSAEVSLAKYFVVGEKVVTAERRWWRGLRVDFSTAVPPEQLLGIAGRQQVVPGRCVVVSEVRPSSVSWKSGVRPGMFVSHVGETRVGTPAEFWNAVENADASVRLRFTGGGPPPARQEPR